MHACNCPYEGLAVRNPELCAMDHALLTNLVGLPPQHTTRLADGASSCTFQWAADALAENKTEPNLSN
jgi:predicted ArsR family transcriptional regulator